MTNLLTKRYDHLHKDTLITLIQRLEKKLEEEQKLNDTSKRPSLLVIRENIQLRERIERAEHLNNYYIKCFTYLLTLDEFAPLLVKLRKHMREE